MFQIENFSLTETRKVREIFRLCLLIFENIYIYKIIYSDDKLKTYFKIN